MGNIERKALVIFTACLVAGEMAGSLKKGSLLLAEMANVLGICAAEGGCGKKKETAKKEKPRVSSGCMFTVRYSQAPLHQFWSLSNQKLHLPHHTNVFSSFRNPLSP